MPPYLFPDQPENGDGCPTCGNQLKRAVIAHDPVNGNTLGWECPYCRDEYLGKQNYLILNLS